MGNPEDFKYLLTRNEWVKNIKDWIKSLISFVLFLWVYIIVVNTDKYPDWLILKKWGSISIKDIYDEINKYNSLNSLIVFISICLAFYFCYRIIRDKDFRLGRILLIVVGWIVLWCPNVFEYPLIIGYFDYRFLWTLLLLGVFICCAITSVKILKQRIALKRSQLISNTNELIHDKNVETYSYNIINRLLDIDLSEAAFAVGVTSEWGSGKTTFLSIMKNQLMEHYKDKVEIVNFNPWSCHSPEQVINYFFKTLREELAPKHSQLSRPIKDYAKYLNAIKIPDSLSFLDSLKNLVLNEESDSIQKKRDHLSSLFSRMTKPVYVFIDDLDRLESDEVFEVLRLIRNTADFSNMMYIVVYDKEYIVSVLKRLNVKDGSSYLEKIFPLELHLPKVSNSVLFEMLKKSMMSLVKDDSSLANLSGITSEVMMRLLGSLNEDQIPLLLSVLNSFRRIRNFAHRYLLLLSHIQSMTNTKNEIKFKDLLWLELIEMYDKSIYEILYNDPERLLKIEGKKYVLLEENEYKTINNNGEKTELCVLPTTRKLLEMLFKQNDDLSRYSMRYRVNYNYYFYLMVPPEDLSNKEFLCIYKDEDIANQVNNWIQEEKDTNSVYFRFHEYRPKGSEKSVAYLKAILEYGVKKEQFSLYAVGQLLDAKRFLDVDKDELRDEIKTWFNEQPGYNYSKEILKGLFVPKNIWYNNIEYKEEETCNEKYLIKNNDIEEILMNSMKAFLNDQPDLDLMEIFQTESDFGKMFGTCCLLLRSNEITWESYWKNVAFDIVIEHFSKVPKYLKSDIEEARKEFRINLENKYLNKNLHFSNQDEIDAYNEHIYEKVDSDYESYFGSDNSKFKKLIDNCTKKEKKQPQKNHS